LITKIETEIEGCYELQPIIRKDQRGSFTKTFHEEVFKKNNLVTKFAEEYYSTSRKGVLRGLHFQTPPVEHEKMVYCVYGEVIDVAVDLRRQSSTYGKYRMINLNSEKGNIIYIPKGMAHGFYTVSDMAIIMYKVTSVYVPQNDLGILWNSIGIPWIDKNPIMSERDKNFIEFKDFKSPF